MPSGLPSMAENCLTRIWVPDTATASLFPSGDKARPSAWIHVPDTVGVGRAVSFAVPAAGSSRSAKNFITTRPLAVGWPAGCAASTNVRSSAAPVTQVKVAYGRGGRTVASTAPVAVARTTARVDWPASGPGASATSYAGMPGGAASAGCSGTVPVGLADCDGLLAWPRESAPETTTEVAIAAATAAAATRGAIQP